MHGSGGTHADRRTSVEQGQKGENEDAAAMKRRRVIFHCIM
jgi:hypothetical protein